MPAHNKRPKIIARLAKKEKNTSETTKKT